MSDTAIPAAPEQPAAPDIERPACFYLGREYDLQAKQTLDRPVMYDARDLTTHGVVVGMTGSGKTGLCISLLEEAVIDGYPCILIDPKGDLANLLLQFPDLDPAEFARWVNPDEARQKELSLDDYAKELADRWREGLKSSWQDVDRIKRLKEASQFRIYTPGSEAGLPLSVLRTFAAPKGKLPREALNQKIDATASALLGLTGTAADPVQSREHILIAQLLLNAWTQGRDLDLPTLINQVQVPPPGLQKIGAIDLEMFYPEKERTKLAVALNNILAAPSFSTWITGAPLDLGQLLYRDGKPCHVIFYVAHLDDSQRLFFITLLLEEVLSWTRKQQGTTALRALLYFDEVFGYLPPHPANPPTKPPLMTLLKQARAFGVGVLLATQNPVDLDYKALSNAGTWFVGKLQTERDKKRLVEGLEGVAAERGTLTHRGYLETVISALGNRVFLLHNVHKGKPLLFQTRQALSFLRGPMTLDQIEKLMEPLKDSDVAPPTESAAPVAAILLCRKCHAEIPTGERSCRKCGEALAPSPSRIGDESFKQSLAVQGAAAPVPDGAPSAPPLPSDVPQVYLARSNPARPVAATALLYLPRLFGVAEVSFHDKKRGATHRQRYGLLAAPPTGGQSLAWEQADRIPYRPGSAEADARWGAVPDTVTTARKLKAFEKTFADFLYRGARIALGENSKLGLVAQPGEDAQAFRERSRAAARQEAERAVAAERARYLPEFQKLGATMPEPGAQQSDATLIDYVNPLWWLGVMAGSKPAPKKGDKVAKLEAEWLAKQSAIYEKWRQVGEDVSDVTLVPRRQDVQVSFFGIAWAPFWQMPGAGGRGELVAAYR